MNKPNRLSINGPRLWRDIDASAQIGKFRDVGLSRMALSEDDGKMRDLFVQWCEDQGLDVAIDRVGNIFARREGSNKNLPPVVVGSHLDTQTAGGRFDGLVEQLGGKPTAAAGFALGVERILALLEAQQERQAETIDIYMVLLGEDCELAGLQKAEEIRDRFPELKMITHCGGGSMKSQMKKADKSGADIALILGEDELKNEQFTVKYLRKDKPQTSVSFNELNDFIAG